MSRSEAPSDCPSCGAAVPEQGSFCPACGALLAREDGDTLVEELPPVETTPGPVAVSRVEPRWLGIPASLFLLCLGFAALGAAVGLFAAGRWPWGLVLAGAAVLLLLGWAELTRQRPRSELTRRSALALADGRSRATTAAEVLRARAGATLHRRRTQTALGLLEQERGVILRELGTAVWSGDGAAEERSRKRLEELDERRAAVERELAERLAGAEERIRRAQIPVEATMMVAPEQPSTPYPPPGEGDPPQPAIVPEPYPPPDEGTPPTPEPDPGPPPER